MITSFNHLECLKLYICALILKSTRMKRFSKLIAHIAIAEAMPLMPLMVSAGVTNVGVLNDYSIDFVPKQFSFGNKVSMYIDNSINDTNGDEIKTKFTIYGGDFQVIKTFTTPEFQKVSYNGKWGPNIEYADVESMSISDNNCIYPEYFYLTQTLFNNDEAYELFEPKLSVIDTEDGKSSAASSFRVLSDNGNVVIDENFVVDESFGNNIHIDGVKIIPTKKGVYMLICLYNMDEDEMALINKIEPESSSVKQVAVHRNLRVKPSATHRGTAVNVDLGEPIGNNAKLSVVSMSGRTVVTQNLTPGSTEAVIDTYRFEPGVYVVVLNNGETEREPTKIVVR